MTPSDTVTEGHLLGGRVRYTQPASGFRSGIEPVLLAASIPARAAQRVVEGGTGAGAALLCLTARVPSVTGCGIEVDPAQAALAAANMAANGMAGLRMVAGDISSVVLDGLFDHAFANPPYHPETGSPSPDPGRALATRGASNLFGVWAASLGRCLRARGTLTFILPAATLPACLAAMSAAGCPAEVIFPLWPKSDAAAKLVIVRGIKAGRGPMRLLSGLVLHEPDGGFSTAADAILRGGRPLALARSADH